VVERAADVRHRLALAGIEHADAGNQDDARRRFKHDVAFVLVALEVGFILLLVVGDAFDELLLETFNVIGIGRPVDEERYNFRVNEVVRTGGADPGQLRRVRPADEREHVVLVVEREDHLLVSAHRAAHGRHHFRGDLAARLGRQRRVLLSAEQFRVVNARFDVRRRFIDDADRLRVARLRRVAPRDKAVLLHQDELGLRIGEHAFGDHFRQLEARADVRHPDEPVAENLLRDPPAVIRAADADDRVRMRVVDVLERQERVQQRLDRSARMLRVDHAVREIRDHLLVGHVVPLEERADVVHAQAGEVVRLHRREVGAAAFDVHDLDVAAAEVFHGHFAGRVAAAPVADATIAAEQIRAIDEFVESAFEPRRLGRFPQVSHHCCHSLRNGCCFVSEFYIIIFAFLCICYFLWIYVCVSCGFMLVLLRRRLYAFPALFDHIPVAQ